MLPGRTLCHYVRSRVERPSSAALSCATQENRLPVVMTAVVYDFSIKKVLGCRSGQSRKVDQGLLPNIQKQPGPWQEPGLTTRTHCAGCVQM